MKYALLIVVFIMSGCTSKTDANRALDAAGYSDITIGGYSWFDCSKDDFYHTEFTAKNPSGKYISGTVCSGLLFKSATIRF